MKAEYMIQQWEAEKQSSSLDALDHIALVAVYKQITRLDHLYIPWLDPFSILRKRR
jgi:hypothetical protein